MISRLPTLARRLALLALLPLVASHCPFHEDPDPTCVRSDRRAVVFFDGSASASGDGVSKAAFEGAVSGLAGDVLQCEGDRVTGYVLFSNTGTAYSVEVDVLTEAKDLSDAAEIDRPRLRSAWERSMEGEREDAATLLWQQLVERADVPQQARQETDVLGSLRLVEEAFQGQPDSSARRVLYLSDMYESTRRTRDFDVRPPADAAQAKAWAAEDVARLVGDGEVSQDALRGAEVAVVRSTLGIDPRANDVRAYWVAVFEALGAADVDMR